MVRCAFSLVYMPILCHLTHLLIIYVLQCLWVGNQIRNRTSWQQWHHPLALKKRNSEPFPHRSIELFALLGNNTKWKGMGNQKAEIISIRLLFNFVIKSKLAQTDGCMCDSCIHNKQKLERELFLNWKRNAGMPIIFKVWSIFVQNSPTNSWMYWSKYLYYASNHICSTRMSYQMDFIFQCLAFCGFEVVKRNFTVVAQSFLYLHHKIAIEEIIYSTEFFSDTLLCKVFYSL